MCVCVCVYIHMYLFKIFIYLFGLPNLNWSTQDQLGPFFRLHCGMQILSCSMWDLVLSPKIETRPLHWECRVLVTEPPEKFSYLFVLIFFSIISYYNTLNIVLCAIRRSLFILYTVICIYLSGTASLSPSTPYSPLWQPLSLFSVSVSLFLFRKYIQLYHFLDFT